VLALDEKAALPVAVCGGAGRWAGRDLLRRVPVCMTCFCLCAVGLSIATGIADIGRLLKRGRHPVDDVDHLLNADCLGLAVRWNYRPCLEAIN